MAYRAPLRSQRLPSSWTALLRSVRAQRRQDERESRWRDRRPYDQKRAD